MKRYCPFCKQDGIKTPSAYKAEQSSDQGKTRTVVYPCDGHGAGWNDGGDWNAPITNLDN